MSRELIYSNLISLFCINNHINFSYTHLGATFSMKLSLTLRLKLAVTNAGTPLFTLSQGYVQQLTLEILAGATQLCADGMRSWGR